MSEEKVRKYKEDKKNRQAILKKEKRQRLIARILMSLAGVAVVAFIGWSVYYVATKDHAGTDAQVVNIQALEDFTRDIGE